MVRDCHTMYKICIFIHICKSCYHSAGFCWPTLVFWACLQFVNGCKIIGSKIEQIQQTWTIIDCTIQTMACGGSKIAEPETTQAPKRYKTADGTEATKRLLEIFDEHTDWEKFVFGLRDERCFPISKPQNQTRPHTTDQTWQTQTRQHPTQAPGQTPTTSQHHSTGSCHAARGSTRRGCWTLFWQ